MTGRKRGAGFTPAERGGPEGHFRGGGSKSWTRFKAVVEGKAEADSLGRSAGGPGGTRGGGRKGGPKCPPAKDRWRGAGFTPAERGGSGGTRGGGRNGGPKCPPAKDRWREAGFTPAERGGSGGDARRGTERGAEVPPRKRQMARSGIHSRGARGVRGGREAGDGKGGRSAPPQEIDGAEGRTRTGMACATRPSNVRVYQFRHFGTNRRFQTDPLTSWAVQAPAARSAWSLAQAADRSSPCRLRAPQVSRGRGERSSQLCP